MPQGPSAPPQHPRAPGTARRAPGDVSLRDDAGKGVAGSPTPPRSLSEQKFCIWDGRLEQKLQVQGPELRLLLPDPREHPGLQNLLRRPFLTYLMK